MEAIPDRPELGEPVDQYVRRVERYISGKYLGGKILDDGRRDAQLYASAAFMLHARDDFFGLSTGSEQWDKEQLAELEEAIARSNEGDWQGLRGWLLADAAISRGVSTAGGKLISEEDALESENRATALINLANSIQ